MLHPAPSARGWTVRQPVRRDQPGGGDLRAVRRIIQSVTQKVYVYCYKVALLPPKNAHKFYGHFLVNRNLKT